MIGTRKLAAVQPECARGPVLLIFSVTGCVSFQGGDSPFSKRVPCFSVLSLFRVASVLQRHCVLPSCTNHLCTSGLPVAVSCLEPASHVPYQCRAKQHGAENIPWPLLGKSSYWPKCDPSQARFESDKSGGHKPFNEIKSFLDSLSLLAVSVGPTRYAWLRMASMRGMHVLEGISPGMSHAFAIGWGPLFA